MAEIRQSWIPLLKKRSLPGRAFVMSRKGEAHAALETHSENSCVACGAHFINEGSETPRLLFLSAQAMDHASDELLSRMVQAMGFARGPTGQVHVLVTGGCPMCGGHVQSEIARLKPKAVVALGSAAGNLIDSENVTTIAHPSEIAANAELKRQAWVELKRIMQELS